jgi:hypothetical protein
MGIRSFLSGCRPAPAFRGHCTVVDRQYGFYPSTNNNEEHKNVIGAASKAVVEPIFGF